jgi:glc operon protein GlcG
MLSGEKIRMSISIEKAQALVAKAVQAGIDQQCPIAVAVTDPAGFIVAAARLDGCGHINLQIACKKALAAASFGIPTSDLIESISRDPFAKAVVLADQTINVLPGGIPLKDGDAVIGAIGVAGGYYLQDRAIAEFAIS